MESVKKWLYERGTKRNGVYVHYSPPKLVTAGEVRQWARGGAGCRLERLVLAGRGRRLLAHLDRLPAERHLKTMLYKCEALHAAVERGSLLELQELLQSEYNKRKLLMCLDEAGAGLLHKAIYYDYMDIAEWLVSNYPQLVHQRDSLGRTPLHYTANCRKAGLAAALLEGAGAARGARDAAGRSPAQYRAAAAIALPQPDMPPQRTNNPPGLVIKRHNIRIWCHDCDMARLQRVVWEGHGKALLSEVSNQPVVKRFLEAVPYIMNTIRDIHNAVIENDLEGLMKYSGDPVPPQILSSRDVNNMTVMHKAAGLGHGGILGYIAERYPQGINDVDNDGRTPLHYAAAVRDEQHIYNTLVSLGADEGAMDNKNKPPGYYINKPHEIDKNLFKTLPDAPRTPSSAYPPSWDWKILDTEPIVESNKKTRKKTKASDNSTSKNNTNSISESTSNRRGMKGSSTQEFIKELPDLDDKLTKPNGNVDNQETDVVEENSDETDKDTQQLDETSDQKDETAVETEENDESQKQQESQQEPDETDDIKSIEHHENSEANDVQEENTNEESKPSDEKDSDKHNENEGNEKVELDEHNAENPAKESNDESKFENEALESDKNTPSEHNDGEPENNGSHKPSEDILEDHEKESSIKDNAEHENTDNEEDKNENSEEEQEKIVDYSNGNNHNHHINSADTSKNTTHKTENTQHEHENGTQSSNIIVYEHPNTTQERNMIRDYSNPNTTEKMSKSNDDNKTGQIDEQSEDDDDVQVQGDIHPDSGLPSINASEVKKIGSAKRLNTTVSSGNASDGRYSQDSLIEGIISGDAEQDTLDASITQKDETVHGEMYNIESEIDPEVADLINTANMEMLATLVLNGEGSRLVGRRSYNAELQAFLDNVPMYMQKINKVHIAAREGNIRDLQAALDRRKFAIARDPISPNGATPLHVATIFGKTNIMKYLGGRFPETLSAVDFEGRTALHYAAVLPDNGHYYNLLQQLGANVKDLDDNGKSAEDYYNDPGFLTYTQLFAEYGISDEAAENMFSDKGSNNAANGRMDTPVFNTDEGRYLAKSLGDPLIKGLTEVANVKPKDPVAFLASFLHNFPEHEKPRLGTQESKAMVTHEQPEMENEVPAPTVAVAAAAQPQVSRSAARTATRPYRPIDVVTVDPQADVSPDAPEAASSSVNRDEHGQSMLHFAAARKHTNNALFQLIQESDISLGYRDELYRTARDVSIQANIAENTEQIDRFVLHLAARGNTREIMELLLEGYDHILDVVDDEEVPITDVIAQRGNTEMSNLLASIPAFEESRESLHNAIRRGDLVMVQKILSAEGGRTLARAHNTFSRTALHVAVLAQHEDIVAYLVQTFPELLKIGDNLERTPLHYAMGVEKMESLSRLLIRAGAKRVLKDLKGRQPTYYFMNKSDILRLKEEEEVY